MLRGGVLATLLAPSVLAGVTSPYERGSPSVEISIDRFDKHNAAQIFVSPAAPGGLTVGWVTSGPKPASGPNVKWLCADDSSCSSWSDSAADTTSYTSGPYHSGNIHHAQVAAPRGAHVNFTFDGKKAYQVRVPRGPGVQDTPFTLAVVGDIGQTQNSASTIQHLMEDAPDLVVIPGDLSYADCDNTRWDSWDKLAQPMTSSVPILTVPGNHEIESGCGPAFQAYTMRYRMPVAPGSPDGTMYYSYEAGGVHFVLLSSYSPISPGSPQYDWLVNDLASVDRKTTPWLVAALHAPWYNSNSHHQGEGEPAQFQTHAEPLLYNAGVDLVFSGHVHAYERSVPSNAGRPDPCGITYITIGDGGNREGLAMGWADPQPEWSAFRESSYGHGRLVILNATHATWTWHRNNEGEKVSAEEVTIAADTEGCPNSRVLRGGLTAAEQAAAAAGAAMSAVPKLRPLRLKEPGAVAADGGAGVARLRKAAASRQAQRL